MKLNELLEYDNIVVQCHDNPDADAIASGFGLHRYFKSNGKNVIFAYSGHFLIKKSNLKLMVDELNIPIVYAINTRDVIELLNRGKKTDEIGLLITVDSQYGQGNISSFTSKNIATIDHHQVDGKLPELSEVRSELGSCSTIIWDMLRNENYPIDDDVDLSTALYYGLLTDTSNFADLHDMLDRKMQDNLKVQSSFITRFRNSNISKEELSIAGDALRHAIFLDEYNTAIVSVKPCDPNVLGIVSDITLEVDSLDTVLAYSILDSGVKISVRSCCRQDNANEIAEFIAEEVGNGGGRLIKAGGFLKRELLEKHKIEYTSEAIGSYIYNRMVSYFENQK